MLRRIRLVCKPKKNQQKQAFSTCRMSSATLTTEKSHGANWVTGLSVSEMKKMVGSMPEAKSCLERADLERLVASKFESMEDYKSSRVDASNDHQSSSSSTRMNNLKAILQNILSQDRGALNFEHYSSGKDHLKRMEQLAKVAPELYDNPDITPRSKWFQHPRYRQNSQMPPFHIHFRHEMQDVVRYLYQAYAAKDSATQRQDMRRASSVFHGSMRGLNGHVSIEEYACFPTYKSLYPHVDIRFLYTDHKKLHQAEEKASEALVGLVEAQQDDQIVSQDRILDALEVLIEFDEQLMAHLGEEEEIVVPMSLTEKDLFF